MIRPWVSCFVASCMHLDYQLIHLAATHSSCSWLVPETVACHKVLVLDIDPDPHLQASLSGHMHLRLLGIQAAAPFLLSFPVLARTLWAVGRILLFHLVADRILLVPEARIHHGRWVRVAVHTHYSPLFHHTLHGHDIRLVAYLRVLLSSSSSPTQRMDPSVRHSQQQLPLSDFRTGPVEAVQ